MKPIILILALVLAPGLSSLGATLHVPADYLTLKEAIEAALPGDTVLVAAGEHMATDPISFEGKELTLRSETGPEATILRRSPTTKDPTRLSVVVFENGEGPGSVLDGFTIRGIGGHLRIDGQNGILLTRASSPILKNCIISGNDWSGVYCSGGSSPTLVQCTISRNSASGLFCIESSSPTLKECTIAANTGSQGGGIFCWGSGTASLINCRISGNSADWDGGGVACWSSTVNLLHCNISGNSAILGGGGVVCFGGGLPRLVNCTVSGNSSAYGAGGVECESNTFLTVTSSIVWGNSGATSFSSPDSDVTYSSIESEVVWPGIGNRNEDPLFCGWGAAAEIYVNGANPSPGDGTKSNPFSNLGSALEYSLALSRQSPCLGTGEGGENMGADAGTCEMQGEPRRLLHVGPGNYDVTGLNMAHGVSLEGESQEKTILHGTVFGLRSGAVISSVTVTEGSSGGVVVDSGQAPAIKSSTITGNKASFIGSGVYCGPGSSTTISDSTITRNASRDNLGGGLLCVDAEVTLSRCAVSENFGQGLRSRNSSVELTDCSLNRNAVGVGCEESSSLNLYNCTISKNYTGVHYGEESTGALLNCVISGNPWGGMSCSSSSPILKNCTLFENGRGIACFAGSQVTLDSSIVWGNASDVSLEDGSVLDASYSCFEGEERWPGLGNINIDPLFCSMGPAKAVHVDPRTQGPGDGTEGKPYSRIDLALDYSLALSSQSPCLKTARGGANMGANTGVCELPGTLERVVHLAPGTYSLEGFDLRHHISILGSSQEDTIIQGHVLGLRTGAVLSRLTVTGVKTRGAGLFAAVVIDTAEAPELRQCTIARNNSAGVICGSATLTNCTVSENSGVGIQGDQAKLIDCTIARNGLGVNAGSATLIHCAISGNLGGGVRCGQALSPVLNQCTILGNSASHGAGVFCEHASSPILTNCKISGNWAGSREPYLGGGGVFCDTFSWPVFTNCTITGNSAAGGNAGGMVCGGEESSATLINCIVWGNTGKSISCLEPSVPDITYSCIQGGWQGTGNTNKDPLFVSPAIFHFDRFLEREIEGTRQRVPDFIEDPGDYRLRLDSPAIDQGTPAGSPGDDLEGNQRPCGAGVDMGAYEFCGPSPVLFQRGDFDANSSLNLSDAVSLLLHLFLGGKKPSCEKSADSDDNGLLDLVDAIHLLNYLFLGGPAPGDPFPACGVDPSADALTCESYAPCE